MATGSCGVGEEESSRKNKINTKKLDEGWTTRELHTRATQFRRHDDDDDDVDLDD